MVNTISTQEEWKEWANSRRTKEFFILLRERRGEYLEEFTKIGSFDDFCKLQGIIRGIESAESLADDLKGE